eukprot:m.90809 g.90809  ORF g.90809 m.90809 type:complete len:375 (+) comp15279_c0_seq1:152-1276(+)
MMGGYLTKNERMLESAIDTFGFKLFARLTSKEKNVFMSPISIALAMAMLANAASHRSSAEKELNESLGLAFADENVLMELKEEIAQLLEIKDIQLLVANSVWSRLQLRDEFLSSMRLFDAEVQKLTDAKPINDWAATATKGAITSLIDEIRPDVVCVLLNAIYFKGSWQNKFDEANTYDDVFLAPGTGETGVPCKMMSKEFKETASLHNDQVEIVSLPYGTGRFSAVILLPRDTSDKGLPNLVSSLSTEVWDQWMSSLHPETVHVHMPRFKMEFGTRGIKSELAELGMKTVFHPGQLQRAFDDPTVGVSDVLHKAVLEVNEEGTTAAAVTAVIMSREMHFSIPFRLDRPFIFSVYDNATKLVLFIGQVDHPVFT